MKKTYKLGRKAEHLDRTLRNLATSLVMAERVVTTSAKAHAVVPMVERLIHKASTKTLEGRRAALAVLFDPMAVRKLLDDAADRLERTSGYTRMTKLPPRKGDGASMVLLELLLKPLDQVAAEATGTTVTVKKKAAKPSES